MIAICEYCKTKHIIDASSLKSKAAFSFRCVSCSKKNRLVQADDSSEKPVEINCPHCGRSYSISGGKGEQILSFLCRCGKTFENPFHKKQKEKKPSQPVNEQTNKKSEGVIEQNKSSIFTHKPKPDVKPKPAQALSGQDLLGPSGPGLSVASAKEKEPQDTNQASYVAITPEPPASTPMPPISEEDPGQVAADNEGAPLNTISEDAPVSLEEMYKEAIKFDDAEETGKNYIAGSVPMERKHRFFLRPNPVSEKFYFNKIKKDLDKHADSLNANLHQDEFDKELENVKVLQNLKNTQNILNEYGKSYIKEKSISENKQFHTLRYFLLFVLTLTFLGLVVYTYLQV